MFYFLLFLLRGFFLGARVLAGVVGVIVGAENERLEIRIERAQIL